MKAPSKTCRNCGGSGFYSRMTSFNGMGNLVMPIGLRSPECKVRVCGDCGLVEWFASEEYLQMIRENYALES
ncbi:hypothetical protein [Haloferula sp. BvORR071]|uniref:hypothetical protein n=1 Tax=Haloferula sp. BvORR071 TaxID=1396141 RepID=UPI002240F54F|nr:hypothetical protein [Haloferula sp. BvORR071]